MECGRSQMAVSSQFVLYRDDSVEVSYLDGSKLLLSPCGSTFVHCQPPGQEQHPLHGVRRVQQRSRFATSEFREKVIQGIEFRNKFAECPYICRDLLQASDVTILHSNVTEISWPNCVKDLTVSKVPNGGATVTSTDGHATLTLSPCKQQFSVRYLARVSQERKRLKPNENTSHNLKPKGHVVNDNKLSPREYSRDETLSSEGKNLRWQQDHALDGSYREIILENEVNHYELNKKRELVNRTSTPNHLQESLSWQLSSVNTQNVTSQTDSRLNPDGATVQGKVDEGDARWEYIWLVQFCSVQDCPENWKPALKLAFECTEGTVGDQNETLYSNDSLEIGNTSSDSKQNDSSPRAVHSDSITCSLPKSLPLNCPASHLHRQKDEVQLNFSGDPHGCPLKRVKVLFTHGIVYRLLWKSAPRVVEIFPGDGSVLRSQGTSGSFFTHTVFKEGQIEERVHSVKCPPPKIPGSAYSVANLIKTGAGLLYTMVQDNIQLVSSDQIPCWQINHEKNVVLKPVSTILLEESFVPGMGKFSAYSNGHVRVVFEDRTCLDMICDFSKRVNSCLEHSEDEHQQVCCSSPQKTAIDGVLPGQCRLLLPSAQYAVVSVTDAGWYSRYVQVAQEWAGWVNSSPSERYMYYKDTIYDADRYQSVQTELKKINCFNYIVENTLFQTQHSAEQDFQVTLQSERLGDDSETLFGVGNTSEEMSLETVRRALQQTANAISDIDQLLSSDNTNVNDNTLS